MTRLTAVTAVMWRIKTGVPQAQTETGNCPSDPRLASHSFWGFFHVVICLSFVVALLWDQTSSGLWKIRTPQNDWDCWDFSTTPVSKSVIYHKHKGLQAFSFPYISVNTPRRQLVDWAKPYAPSSIEDTSTGTSTPITTSLNWPPYAPRRTPCLIAYSLVFALG